MFLDVTDQAQIDAVAGQIAGGGGSLDGVVNDTGIGRGGPLEYLPLETWREQLEVNVLGQVAVTKAMLPFIRAAHGRIVFIGSISGKVATQLTGPYGASKFAIEAIGESLRSELRPWGISVSVVEPAAVKTPIWDKTRQEADRLERALPEEARTRSLARGGTVFLDVASNRWDRSARHNAAGFEGKARIGWVQICCTVMVLVMIGRWLERP